MSDCSDLVELYGAVLDLCRLKEGETFAVLTEGGERSVDASAYLAAAERRGAHQTDISVGE